MLTEELRNLIDKLLARKCEMQNIELKSASGGTPEKLYDTLSGFANQSGGGIIIFGLQEKPEFKVIGVYDAQDLQVKVTNYALQMEPVIRPVFTVTDYDGKTVVSAEIPECDINDKPCYYKGAGRLRGSYVRVGDADLPMTEYEVYSYEAYKKKIRDELRIVERASVEDFSKKLLDEFFVKLRNTKSQLAMLDDQKILRLQGMTDHDKPTVVGTLLLCDYPQAFFPQLGITAMVVDGTEFGVSNQAGVRFIDNKRIDGTIPQMLEEAISFVRRNTRNATIVNDDGKREDRSEYPMKAVREVILNALVHRDYSIHSEDSPVRVVLYSDRLEVENPGGLYGRLTVNDLGKMPGDTRNPFLAGNLEILIDTENRFSGIPTIISEMKNAGLRPPVFESRRGNFKVILYNDNGQRRTPETEEREDDLLAFFSTPRSKEDVADFVGVKSPYYAMRRYIKPLLDAGVLAMTIPDKPKSVSQRYVRKGN